MLFDMSKFTMNQQCLKLLLHSCRPQLGNGLDSRTNIAIDIIKYQSAKQHFLFFIVGNTVHFFKQH